jgi:hypothetical protein
MESNQSALAIVDAAFSDLERKIAELDRLSDDLQTSRENIQKLDAESDRIKNDADGLERSKRVSKLTALNGSLEIEKSDNSRLVSAIQAAKARVVESGRAVRNLIAQILFQLSQTRKLNAVALLEKHFVVRKIPLRLTDLATTARGVVETREWEETLTKPSRDREEEIGSLFSLKARFEPIRTAVLNEENLVLELRTAEEPVVPEPAATEVEPALA